MLCSLKREWHGIKSFLPLVVVNFLKLLFVGTLCLSFSPGPTPLVERRKKLGGSGAFMVPHNKSNSWSAEIGWWRRCNLRHTVRAGSRTIFHYTPSMPLIVLGLGSSDEIHNGREVSDRFGTTKDGFRTRIKGVAATTIVTIPKLIPALLGLGLGLKIGGKGNAERGMEQAAKSLTSSASSTSSSALATSSSTSTSILATSPSRSIPYSRIILMVILARQVWRTIPDWVKSSLPFVGRNARRRRSALTMTGEKQLTREIPEEDPNDLTSLTAIAGKLQALYYVMMEKLEASATDSEEDGAEETLVQSTSRSAFFALLQLTQQLKEQRAEARDERYSEDGQAITPEKSPQVLKGLDEYFEYADWAYDEWEGDKGGEDINSLQQALKSKDYNLVRHDKTALPGHVAHYIAISKKKKEIIISIKGTSNFEDILTDCCGRAVTHELKGPFLKPTYQERTEFDKAFNATSIRCHEGVMLAAQRLADDLEPLMDQLFLPTGYQIVVTGHSLGAGVAALFGIIIRSRFPSKLRNDDGSKLKVLAFASPPVLDHDSSLASKSFVTTIVNNSDMIPRASLSNLLVLTNFLRIVDQKMEERGIKPKDATSTAQLMKWLMEGKDGEMLLTAEEFRDGLDKAITKVKVRDPDHLYVPGRVLLLYDLWSKADYEGEEKAEAEAEAIREGNVEVMTRTAERLQITDATSRLLRSIELDPRMLTDHLSPGYRTSLKCMLNSEYHKV